jgi:hypothetical protein
MGFNSAFKGLNIARAEDPASPYIAESQFYSGISLLLTILRHPRDLQITVCVAPCCHAAQLTVRVCVCVCVCVCVYIYIPLYIYIYVCVCVCVLYSCQGLHMCLFLSR